MNFITFKEAKNIYESNYKGFWATEEDAIKDLKKGDLKVKRLRPRYKFLCWHPMYGFYLR